MRWAISLGRITGIEVRIHLTFFVLLAGLGALDYREGGAHEAIHGGVLTCLFFFCVLLHEFGHAFAARRLGIRTPDITLFPFGGIARIERLPENPLHEIAIALAGPAVNLVIAAGLWAALAGAAWPASEAMWEMVQTPLGQILLVNVSLLVFNLIPAFPMDGGRVLRALLALRLGHSRATQIAARLGQGIALLFGFAGVFGPRFGLPQNPMFLLVAVFVFLAAGREARGARLKFARAGMD